MKKQSLKYLLLCFLFSPMVVHAADYIVCGSDKKFPLVFADVVSLLYTLVRIVVPILFVVVGLISFLRALFSNSIDSDLDKAKNKLVVNIIIAGVIFFVVSIINFVINLAAGTGNSFSECLNCLINPSMCAKQEVVDKKVCPGLDEDQSLYDDNCNLIDPNKKNNKVDYSTGGTGVTDYTSNNPGTTATNTPSVDNSDVKIENINGVTYVNGILIVNKTYSLPSDYKGVDTNLSVCIECLTSETQSAFDEMDSDAKAIGLNLKIGSAFRSYSYQEGLYNRRAKDNKKHADESTARPGHSEHQTGLCFDLSPINDSFINTPEGKWVDQNCYKYGFIIRYPKDKSNYTGFKYEPWHLRYVGKELAQKLYNNGSWISLEEYFNLSSSYE